MAEHRAIVPVTERRLALQRRWLLPVLPVVALAAGLVWATAKLLRRGRHPTPPLPESGQLRIHILYLELTAHKSENMG